jgi:hypothetical protein
MKEKCKEWLIHKKPGPHLLGELGSHLQWNPLSTIDLVVVAKLGSIRFNLGVLRE